MKETKSVIIRAIVLVIIGWIMLVIFYFTTTEKYYPTLEEAFMRHSGGERGMGEILFMDEHENNLSVYHEKNDGRISVSFTSHYLKKEENSESVYLCTSISQSGQMLNSDLKSIENFKVRTAFFKAGRRTDYKLLNRTPEYGFSRDEKVYSLMIDNQLVDEVIELQTDNGAIYYWYFSDLKIDDFNNIKVSFE